MVRTGTFAAKGPSLISGWEIRSHKLQGVAKKKKDEALQLQQYRAEKYAFWSYSDLSLNTSYVCNHE